MSLQQAAAAWEQLPLGVQQRILVLSSNPRARRVCRTWRNTFDAANDTLSFRCAPESLTVAATAAATRVVRNSASLTAVNYVEQKYATSLPLILSDLLAAGAASGLATRLRKLAGMQLTANCAVQQLQALRQCTGLTHLDISGIELRGCLAEQHHQTAVELVAALQGLHRLTCLHVRDFQLWSAGPEAALASALQRLTQLQHLHIVHSHLGAAGLAALAPALSAMPELQTLDVSDNFMAFTRGPQALSTLLGAVPGLTHLNVSENGLRDEGAALLALALRSMTRVQTLDLGNTSIGDKGMAVLAPALAALPHLHTLRLKWCRLGEVAVSVLHPVLAKEGSPLQHLDLSFNTLEWEGAHALAAGLSSATQLRELNLLAADVRSMGWVALAPALSCLAPSLQSLKLGSESMDAEGSAGLASALKTLTGLTHLQVAEVCTLGAMATIVPALMGMRRLQMLDLHSTVMDTKGTAALAAVLPALAASLMHLDLSKCEMSSEVAVNTLIPALAQATSLTELRLDRIRLEPSGAKGLLSVLSALPHLRNICLSACSLGAPGCMAIAHALQDRDGVLVRLDCNGVTSGTAEGNELFNMPGINVYR